MLYSYKRCGVIYIIRHGQTDWNKEKVMQGQTDIPLNETGKEQAREQGEKLKNIVFDYIFCSPLTRTKQTLKNLNVKCKTKIIYDDRLKERNYGEFEKQLKVLLTTICFGIIQRTKNT